MCANGRPSLHFPLTFLALFPLIFSLPLLFLSLSLSSLLIRYSALLPACCVGAAREKNTLMQTADLRAASRLFEASFIIALSQSS